MNTQVWHLVRAFSRHLRGNAWRVTGATFIVIIAPFLSGALLWSVKLLIDDVFVGGRMELLPSFAAIYVAILAVSFLLGYVQQILDAAIVEQIVQDIRVDLYRHLISISPGSQRKHGVGAFLTHLSGDVERSEYLVYSGPLSVFENVLRVVFFTSFLLLLSWKLTLCALLVVPPLLLVTLSLSPRVRRAAKIARRQGTAWMSLAEERLGALPVIHAFNTQPQEASAFASTCKQVRRSELRTVKVQARMTLLVEIVAGLGGLLVLAVGAYEIQQGGMTVGSLVVFLGSVGSLYGPLRGLAKSAGRFQRAAAAAQRVKDVLDTPSQVIERATAKPLKNVSGDLELRNVHFAYDAGSNVLDDVSLRVKPGETVAIVGPSGGGKTTLVRLVLRLYDPTAGSVLIDGIDIRDVTLDSLRRTIAIVFQESYVFRGSIADNIRYGAEDAPDGQMAEVARAAHVNSFVAGLRAGYGAPVGPRGTWLSGGQRQRIALARALMREAPILLLDEATASVDSETEELIQDAMDQLAGKRTMLIVAHRLSSVRRADRVIVLDHGRIVESGAPEMLLSSKSRCRELFAGQLTHRNAAA